MSAASLDTQERLHQPAQTAQEAGGATAAPASPEGRIEEEQVPQAQPPEADDLAQAAAAERDEYLKALQRLQAEYDNYRRRMQRELAEASDRGGRQLAEQLLTVLDGFDAAVNHGMDVLVPLRRSLQDALTGAGLQRIEPDGECFDPAEHHAVAHDPADDTDWPTGAANRPTVIEVLRPGYRWKERLIRPAMVHVRG